MEIHRPETHRIVLAEHNPISLKDKILRIFGKEQLPRKTFQEVIILDKEVGLEDSVRGESSEVSNSPDQVAANQSFLFEKHHQRYEEDAKTIFGKLERKTDIKKIKNQGVADAEKYYDVLRSRGINRTAAVEYAVKFSENKLSPEQTAEALERHAKIESNGSINGEVYPRLSSCLSVASEIIKLTPEEYQQRLSAVRKYPFLSFYIIDDQDGSQAENFKSFLRKCFSGYTTEILDMYNEFYQRSKNKDPNIKENFYLSYFSTLANKDQEGLWEMSETIAKIEKNLITIFDVEEDSLEVNKTLAEIVQRYDYYFDDYYNEPKEVLFEDLQNKIQLEKYGHKYDEYFLRGMLLSCNKIPTSNFFLKYFEERPFEPLPEKLIKTFPSEDQKLWKMIKAHKDIGELIFEFRKSIDEMFDGQGQPTAHLFKVILENFVENYNDRETDYLKKNLTQDLINSFSENDKKIWTAILKFNSSFSGRYKKESLCLLLDYPDDTDSLLDQKGQPTSLFFEKVLESVGWREFPADDFFKILTPEFFKELSPEDQKNWNVFFKIVTKIEAPYESNNLFELIKENKGQMDRFFSKDGKPNSAFLEELIRTKVISIEDLTHYSVDVFDWGDDKNFWKVICGISSMDRDLIKSFIFKNKDKYALLFDNKNQPTETFLNLFLETYGEDARNHLDKKSYLGIMLSPEKVNTLSKDSQKYWRHVLSNKELYLQNDLAASILLKIKNNVNDYIGDDEQLTPLFFKTLLLTNPNTQLRIKKDLLLPLCFPLYKEKNHQTLLEILDSYNSINKDYGGFFIGRIFQSVYRGQNNRTLTPIGLCAWRIYQDYLKDNKIDKLNPTELKEIFAKIDNEINKKIRFVNNSEMDIPKGLRVSLGTEIEVVVNGLARTEKVNNEDIKDSRRITEQLRRHPSYYLEQMKNEIKQKIEEAKMKYGEQADLITEFGVGKGRDATHEYANDPVTNWSVLLWELSEISNLGFINFDQKFLQYIERGMHLTISGDREGIELDENADLFQNALSVSGYSSDGLDALGASEVIDVVSDSSDKLYKIFIGFNRERGRLRTQVFDDSPDAVGVENRSMSIHSFNHLARTLLYANRLAISLKAYQQFLESSFDQEKKLLASINVLIENNNSLNQILKDSHQLLPDIQDEKLRNSIITWGYFREKSIKAFSEKQKHLSRYKLESPITSYSRRDVTRLGAELLATYGGVSSEGVLLNDAFEKYHKGADPNSLPETERKIILETTNAIGKIFKK